MTQDQTADDEDAFDRNLYLHRRQEISRLEIALSKTRAELELCKLENLGLSERISRLRQQVGARKVRLDLEGRRLVSSGNVWVVIDGRRRYIASPTVYKSLFGSNTELASDIMTEDVAEGPALDDGTSLVRGKHDGTIYLLELHGRDPTLRRIKNWETFTAFCFDFEQVDHAGEGLLDLVPKGRDIAIGREGEPSRP